MSALADDFVIEGAHTDSSDVDSVVDHTDHADGDTEGVHTDLSHKMMPCLDKIISVIGVPDNVGAAAVARLDNIVNP